MAGPLSFAAVCSTLAQGIGPLPPEDFCRAHYTIFVWESQSNVAQFRAIINRATEKARRPPAPCATAGYPV